MNGFDERVRNRGTATPSRLWARLIVAWIAVAVAPTLVHGQTPLRHERGSGVSLADSEAPDAGSTDAPLSKSEHTNPTPSADHPLRYHARGPALPQTPSLRVVAPPSPDMGPAAESHKAQPHAQRLAAHRTADAAQGASDTPPYQIPVFREPAAGVVDMQSSGGRVSLVARATPMNQVVSLLAQKQGINLVCAQDVSAPVSIVLRDVTWQEALTAVLSTAGYTWVQTDGIVRVTSISAGKSLAPNVQGRRLRVFPLDYASGPEVEKAVTGLLSPVGQIFLTESSPADSRRPKDAITVEDLPEFLDRIAAYIAEVDQPPRQVLIEARVLEIKLTDDSVHGVNFKHMFSLMNTNNVDLQLTGMAVASASQAFFAKVSGGNLEALVEVLETTQNAKTLAAPRILVVDGQQANIQVGKQLGYKVTTTTETSTMQDVRFLNVGTILDVTPHIARDGRVWMKVEPKVSSGEINPKTELPEEKTSQIRSQVLLDNGQGIIIGGLIQEKDSTSVQKIPWLGDMWLVGSLFQRRKEEKSRSEIIVCLVPHVQPFVGAEALRNEVDTMRCQTPLVNRCLQPVPRPWEPKPPLDPIRRPSYRYECSRNRPPVYREASRTSGPVAPRRTTSPDQVEFPRGEAAPFPTPLPPRNGSPATPDDTRLDAFPPRPDTGAGRGVDSNSGFLPTLRR